MELSNLGRVKRIQLPAGWMNTRKILGQCGNSYLLRFTPPEISEVRLCFFYRGKLMETQSGEEFQELLKKPAHPLTPAELRQISEVLRDQSLPELFDLSVAKTEIINGKTVLISEGRHLEFNFDSYSLFIDGADDGCAVQEIYFVAPTQEYRKHLPIAMKALQSIEWQ